MALTIGSLFSGIGGFELGLERAGLGPVRWQVEIDPFCRGVLERHWPKATRFADVREVGARNLEPVDLICGGFPCQDISPAGKRAGLSGERSGLWYEFERIVSELRPRWVAVENNGHRWRAWVPDVRRALWRLGYASVPVRVHASEVGGWHERHRVFLIADADGELLRLQQSGGLGPCWQGAIESVWAGAPWAASDNHGERELQPPGSEPEIRRWLGDCVGSWRGFSGTIEPTVGRGVHGIPHRVDRERAIGNAVVPQCAEVVGRMIVQANTAPAAGDEE